MPEISNQFVHLDVKDLPVSCKTALFGMDAEALAAQMVVVGEPAWRGRQLAEALYRQRVADLNEITTLPKALRARLEAEGCAVGRPRIAQVFQSVDGTERYLVQGVVQGSVQGQSAAQESQTVETVWMPEGDDGEAGDGTDFGEKQAGTDKPWGRADRKSVV